MKPESRWKRRTFRPRVTLAHMLAVATVLALAGVALGERPAVPSGEAPALTESGGAQRGPAMVRRAAEQPQAADAAREAVAIAGRAPVVVSRALARAIEQVRAQPAPPGEIYGLVKVTDRTTGERAVFARGSIHPEVARRLDDPEGTPAGKIYAESESAVADAETEVVIRSVFVAEDSTPANGPTEADEDEIDLRERNAGGELSFRIDADLRRLIEKGEIDVRKADGPLVSVSIEMSGVPRLALPKAVDLTTGGLLWVGLDVAAERQRAILERKKTVRELQAPLLTAVERLGGRVVYPSWMSGAVQALVPPRAITALAERPDVFRVEFMPAGTPDTHRYMGDDIFVATNSEDFDVNHSGFHGLSSKHSYTSRVTLAEAEECIDWNSPAWLTLGPGSSSRARFYDINPGTTTLGGLEACWNSTAHSTTGHASHAHGHWVAGNMFGDFMDGQDPPVTATERRRMTGTCPECFLIFMQDWGLDQRTKALDFACDKGVDIFQSSISSGSSCNGSGGYDGTLQDLINCDVVYVQSAGNSGSTGSSCTTSYPADHPWTLAVGGMDTEDPCDTSSEYYTSTCDYDANASRGGGTYDGVSGTASIVDLTGPYRVCHALVPGASGPTQRTCVTGTSFASPVVAGLTGEMLDWWNQHISTSLFYNNRARNWMLLMGDRSVDSAGTSQWLNTTDPRWGAGRIGLAPFDDLGCWTIYRSSASLGRGDSHTFNLSFGDCVDFFKVAVWHDGKNYSNEPEIHLVVNPTGCATATTTRDELDVKAIQKLRLSGCSGADITVRNDGVGSSGRRRFHVAAYGHDGSTERFF